MTYNNNNNNNKPSQQRLQHAQLHFSFPPQTNRMFPFKTKSLYFTFVGHVRNLDEIPLKSLEIFVFGPFPY